MQAVLVFVKPRCRNCARQAPEIAYLSRVARNFELYDVWQHKLEAEFANVSERDTPTAIVTWNGVEQYRTRNISELI